MTKKVLILTYWGYKEALISSFTLPYIQSLHKVNPQMDLFLFTLNKEEQILKNNEIEKANRELSEFNTKLLAFNYRKFGFIALFKMFFLILRLLRIIRKERITHLHCIIYVYIHLSRFNILCCLLKHQYNSISFIKFLL